MDLKTKNQCPLRRRRGHRGGGQVKMGATTGVVAVASEPPTAGRAGRTLP